MNRGFCCLIPEQPSISVIKILSFPERQLLLLTMSNTNNLELAEFKEAFDEFDKVSSFILVLTNYLIFAQDGSGEISPQELLLVMRAMGQNPTEDELQNLVMEIDTDGNGIIDFNEFVAMMKERLHEVDDEADLR